MRGPGVLPHSGAEEAFAMIRASGNAGNMAGEPWRLGDSTGLCERDKYGCCAQAGNYCGCQLTLQITGFIRLYYLSQSKTLKERKASLNSTALHRV